MDAPDPEKCRACQGSGFCARCKGNGKYALRGAPILIRCRDCTGTGLCPTCDGTGGIGDEPDVASSTADPDMCRACSGTGFCTRCRGDGHYVPRGMQAIIKCDRCDGSGACRSCGGTGRVRDDA